MLDAGFVSQLIETIYDAALDPSLWPRAMEATAGFIHGPAAALVLHDALDRRGQFFFSWGDDPYYTRLYFDEYVKIHPLLPQLMFLPAGKIFSIEDILPFEQFHASRFYKEWAEPQGYFDAVSVMVEKSGPSIAHLTVPRHIRDGAVDAEARRRMALIAPHFRRAVGIGRVIDMNKVTATSLADTLDGLDASVFLLDAAGRIVFCNTNADKLLHDGAILRETRGVLSARDPRAEQDLRASVSLAATGDTAPGNSGTALPLDAPDGKRWLAHFLPLTSGIRQHSAVAYTAAVAVFVHRAALDLVSPWESLARQYRLTPGELRTLYALLQVEGTAAAATVLGVSEATLKTHLKRLFEKTGTKRQVDLVKLVASHTSPLAEQC